MQMGPSGAEVLANMGINVNAENNQNGVEENTEEKFNQTEYLRNLQLNPPEDLKALPLDPQSIEVTWKIPTNLRRDKLRFQILLKYFNARNVFEKS